MPVAGESHFVRIKGFIIPTELNRHGRPVEIGIETETFERYIIGPGKQGKELFAHVFSEVEASGTLIGDSSEGNPIFKINAYSIKRAIE